jgi:hypothetical protein
MKRLLIAISILMTTGLAYAAAAEKGSLAAMAKRKTAYTERKEELARMDHKHLGTVYEKATHTNGASLLYRLQGQLVADYDVKQIKASYEGFFKDTAFQDVALMTIFESPHTTWQKLNAEDLLLVFQGTPYWHKVTGWFVDAYNAEGYMLNRDGNRIIKKPGAVIRAIPPKPDLRHLASIAEIQKAVQDMAAAHERAIWTDRLKKVAVVAVAAAGAYYAWNTWIRKLRR